MEGSEDEPCLLASFLPTHSISAHWGQQNSAAEQSEVMANQPSLQGDLPGWLLLASIHIHPKGPVDNVNEISRRPFKGSGTGALSIPILSHSGTHESVSSSN